MHVGGRAAAVRCSHVESVEMCRISIQTLEALSGSRAVSLTASSTAACLMKVLGCGQSLCPTVPGRASTPPKGRLGNLIFEKLVLTHD